MSWACEDVQEGCFVLAVVEGRAHPQNGLQESFAVWLGLQFSLLWATTEAQVDHEHGRFLWIG